MVDPSVINSVKKRNHDAFKKMYECCIRYVYAIVKRYVPNESDHQDIIQEIFARVYLSIDSFDENKGEFKFWLRRLTINQCLQSYRKKKSQGVFVSLDMVTEADSSVEEGWTDLTPAEIESYLSKMPEGYRQIFMLIVIDGYTHKEVGKLLRISATTSRSQLLRAKKWLRKNLLENKSKNLIIGF